MYTNYEVEVEFATPPLKRVEKFLVKTKEDIEELRKEGAELGYRVVSYHIRNVRSASDVSRWIEREILETKRAMHEWEAV